MSTHTVKVSLPSGCVRYYTPAQAVEMVTSGRYEVEFQTAADGTRREVGLHWKQDQPKPKKSERKYRTHGPSVPTLTNRDSEINALGDWSPAVEGVVRARVGNWPCISESESISTKYEERPGARAARAQ